MSTDDRSAPVHLVQCPQCRTPVPWTSEHPFRPFCSDRCRLLDLGAWAEGRHHIPGDADHEEGLPDQPE